MTLLVFLPGNRRSSRIFMNKEIIEWPYKELGKALLFSSNQVPEKLAKFINNTLFFSKNVYRMNISLENNYKYRVFLRIKNIIDDEYLKEKTLGSIHGNLPYMTPEVINGKGYTIYSI
ncbi:18186_t:CDS:2 [Funneliformis geosporum]|nr:18186_t:CDS:2 [Funneliformis geosporum]